MNLSKSFVFGMWLILCQTCTICALAAMIVSCKDKVDKESQNISSKSGPFSGSCDEVYTNAVQLSKTLNGRVCDDYFGSKPEVVKNACEAKMRSYGGEGVKISFSNEKCRQEQDSCQFVFDTFPEKPTVVRWGRLNGQSTCPAGAKAVNEKSQSKSPNGSCEQSPKKKSTCSSRYIQEKTDLLRKLNHKYVALEPIEYSINTSFKTTENLCVLLIYSLEPKLSKMDEFPDLRIEAGWPRSGQDISRDFEEQSKHEGYLEFEVNYDDLNSPSNEIVITKGISNIKESGLNLFHRGDIGKDFSITGTIKFDSLDFQSIDRFKMTTRLVSNKHGNFDLCTEFKSPRL